MASASTGLDSLEKSEASISTFLLHLLQSQDADSWQTLAFLYGPTIQGWLRQAGLHEADAADIQQEVLQSVWKHIDRFHRDGQRASFRRWLWTIVQNKIHDFHRQAKRIPRPQGGTEARMQLEQAVSPAESSTQIPDSSTRELTQLVRRAVELVQGEVQPRTWQAFWLITTEDLTARQVAERLDMNVGAVYTAKSRVLSRLREILGHHVELVLHCV